MAEDAIDKDIKEKTFHRFYLIYGEEDYIRRVKKNKLKKAFFPDGEDMNYAYFSGKDFDQEQCFNTACSVPFFADHRLIVLENTGIFKSASALAERIDDVPESTIMVFVEESADKRNRLYKKVNKDGVVYECRFLDKRMTEAFAVQELSRAGKKMLKSDMEYFIAQTDMSLDNIKNELDKLIAYTGDREIVTREDIKKTSVRQIEDQIFDMLDFISEGRTDKALMLFRDLMELQRSSASVIAVIERHFNILMQVRRYGNAPDRDISGWLSERVPPYFIKKYRAQGRKFTSAQLTEMLDECLNYEYEFKNGLTDERVGLELLIVSLAGKMK